MLTYVINTSENRTFDSSMLFELAGYNKLRWMQCSLCEINKCAQEICNKQNVLGADSFRIAVIVDFYSFDRIRVPYGRRGFNDEQGVDISLYMPYLELFLLDNLESYLERNDLCASDFEVYYIHNEKCERYEIFESAENQLHQIMKGNIPLETQGTDIKDAENQSELRYSSFMLYCTSKVSLEFKLTDYPYGTDGMTFGEFFAACRQRWAYKMGLRRHYYITSYGGGVSRAALDTLSLSLYLVRMYEREEAVGEEEELEIAHLDADVLKDVLEGAWRKINSAKALAKRSNMEYISLDQISQDTNEAESEPEMSAEDAIAAERAMLPKGITRSERAAEDFYREISFYTNMKSCELQKRNREEFDAIMSGYLRQRDNTRASDTESDFLSLKESGFLKTTDRCPSKEEYNAKLGEKQREISGLFEKALDAEYIKVDYKKEKEKADKAIVNYRNAKTCLTFNIIGDIALLLLALLSVLVPYGVLQLSSFTVGTLPAHILGLYTAAFFAGLFVCSLLLQMLPQIFKLRKAKKVLYNCYLDCCAIERYSFSELRRRYEKDLVEIEHKRYEIHRLKRIYDINAEKDRNISVHHRTLEGLEDCISGILNNLDVVPVMEHTDSLDGELNLNKPPMARENKIYKVFSLDTIEKLFPRKKGSDLN